jgi:disulfide bond formation protein DsbB
VKSARLIALLTSLALLLGAYGFQYIGGLAPCEMCWWQRYGHFAALAFAALAFLLPAKRLLVALAGLGIASSAAVGALHAGVEYGWWKGFTRCSTGIDFSKGNALDAIWQATIVPCNVVQWEWLGISMAGYNFLISSAAALVIFALLARKEKQA